MRLEKEIRFMLKRVAIFAIMTPLVSCASSLPTERRDYILSRPHGWVDLTVNDQSIPDVNKSDKDTEKTKPYSCSVSVSVNSESFLNLSVYPDGDKPLYTVSSGFRFPVPVGAHALRVQYTNCRADESGNRKKVETVLPVAIHQDMVTSISFANEEFVNGGEKPNPEITLEKLADMLKEKR
ncbi:MAG TPA: hypothetical protein VMH83_10150 [Candidatus Acidoferrum sp.]|nr:hypothetical protein [Candidatus Acidoferrum sp.]